MNPKQFNGVLKQTTAVDLSARAKGGIPGREGDELSTDAVFAWGCQQQGYRPWMKEGIVFTQNSDLMYVGPLSGSQDITDAVIAWSANYEPDFYAV